MECERKTIVIYPMDAFGHIHPMMFIARELLDRGYRVVVVSTRKASWAPRILKMGLEVVHCVDEPVEANESDLNKLVLSLMNPDPIKSCRDCFGPNGFVHLHLQDMHSQHAKIEATLRSLKPDLVLVDQLLSVPCIMKLDCPVATLFPASPLPIYSNYNENIVATMGLAYKEMTPEMMKWRDGARELLSNWTNTFYLQNGVSIPDDRFSYLGVSSQYLSFYLGPAELDYKNDNHIKPLPDNWFRLEHTIKQLPPNQNGSSFEIPECLRDLPGKLIYFSLGTVASSNPDIINRLLSLLSKSPNKFIVSKGPTGDRVKLHSNMWGDNFLDQKAILSKADMFITHGGHNSTIEAFYYGVPSLIVLPVFGDQFDIAQRVDECGFGKRLNAFTCTEEELLETIESRLADETTKQKMRAIGERLRLIDYPSIAADKLEDLMSNHCKTN